MFVIKWKINFLTFNNIYEKDATWCHKRSHGHSTTSPGFLETHSSLYDHSISLDYSLDQQGVTTHTKCLWHQEKLSTFIHRFVFIVVHSKPCRKKEAFKFNWLENLVILFLAAWRTRALLNSILGISDRFTCEWFRDCQGNWLITQQTCEISVDDISINNRV